MALGKEDMSGGIEQKRSVPVIELHDSRQAMSKAWHAAEVLH